MLESKGLETVEDLLNYFPFRYEDRSNLKPIRQLAPGELATVIAEVRSAKVLGFRRQFMPKRDGGAFFRQTRARASRPNDVVRGFRGLKAPASSAIALVSMRCGLRRGGLGRSVCGSRRDRRQHPRKLDLVDFGEILRDIGVALVGNQFLIGLLAVTGIVGRLILRLGIGVPLIGRRRGLLLAGSGARRILLIRRGLLVPRCVVGSLGQIRIGRV